MPALRSYLALDRRIWTLTAARAVNTFGLSLVMAFMSIYLVTERGMSATATGTIYLGANILQAVSQALAGSFSDRAGRRTTMLVALLLRAALIATLGVLVSVTAPIWAISIALFASWMVRGWFEPVAYATVADLAPPDQRVAAFGLQKIGINLGWAIGPAVGGLLDRYMDYGTIFFCASPMLLLAAFGIARITEPERAAPRAAVSWRVALTDFRWEPAVALFLGASLVAGLMHGQLFSTFAIYAKDGAGLNKDAIGALWAINALIVITLQFPAVALVARVGTRLALATGPLLYAVAFVGFGAYPSFWGLAVAMGLLTIGEVIFEPAQQTAAAELADPTRMGRAMGLLGLMRMLGLACSLQVGGVAFDLFQGRPLSLWTCLAAIPLIAAAGYAMFGVVQRRRHPPTVTG